MFGHTWIPEIRQQERLYHVCGRCTAKRFSRTECPRYGSNEVSSTTVFPLPKQWWPCASPVLLCSAPSDTWSCNRFSCSPADSRPTTAAPGSAPAQCLSPSSDCATTAISGRRQIVDPSSSAMRPARWMSRGSIAPGVPVSAVLLLQAVGRRPKPLPPWKSTSILTDPQRPCPSPGTLEHAAGTWARRLAVA